MFLKQNVPVRPFTEVRNVFEFAQRDGFAERRRAAIIFQNFFAVEPMLDVRAARNDARLIPFTGRIHLLVWIARNQIVKRAKFAVAVAAKFCVGMIRVVKNLIFKADGRTDGGRLDRKSVV